MKGLLVTPGHSNSSYGLLNVSLVFVSVIIAMAMLSGCATKSTSMVNGYSVKGDGETAQGGIGLGTMKRVHFAFNAYDITPEAKRRLAANIKRLKSDEKVTILLEGHTDQRGSTEYNIALGEYRAQAVLKYLVDSGINRDRLEFKSWGEERPINPANTADAYQMNRRAEFVITAN